MGVLLESPVSHDCRTTVRFKIGAPDHPEKRHLKPPILCNVLNHVCYWIKHIETQILEVQGHVTNIRLTWPFAFSPHFQNPHILTYQLSHVQIVSSILVLHQNDRRFDFCLHLFHDREFDSRLTLNS